MTATALDHHDALELCRSHSMFEEERWSVIRDLLRDFVLPSAGCMVHMGLAAGGSLGYFALRYPERKQYGYCAFEKGILGTSPRDGALTDGLCGGITRQAVADWLASLGIQHSVLVDGDVRDSLPAEHEAVALAVVDLNLYEPTLSGLNWLRTHALPGCLVIVDDWDWAGVKAAIDESGFPFASRGYMATSIL